jgi:formylglycine-generating enzyme required for sulfatase activity
MFYRSFDAGGDPTLSGDKNAPATINDFRLDNYEVTVGRFRAFVADGQGTQSNHPAIGAGAHEAIQGSGWDATWNASLSVDTPTLIAALKCDATHLNTNTWTDTPGSNETRPINCVDWYEAMAFCAWDGGRLPTEAEWNYAATGGDEQRVYPWSTPPEANTLDSSRASYAPTDKDCNGDGMAGCAQTDLVPVGVRAAGIGRWGQFDLAGNVNEWTLDWHAPYSASCVDCANLVPAKYQEFRGGSYFEQAESLRTGSRNGTAPDNHFAYIGVRCARSIANQPH